MSWASALTAIKVDAAYMEREARGVLPGVVSCARGVGEVVDSIMALTRSMLNRLRPHELETVGLRGTLQDLVSGWQVRVADRFSCTLDFEGPIDSLSPELNITLYRLIQECLTNAVRHSRARVIAIRVQVAADQVQLRVSESEVAAGTVPDGNRGHRSGRHARTRRGTGRRAAATMAAHGRHAADGVDANRSCRWPVKCASCWWTTMPSCGRAIGASSSRSPGTRSSARRHRARRLTPCCSGSSPDIVLLDLSMPGLGGLSSLRRFKLRWPLLPILVFSMHDTVAFATQALRAGANGYVTKGSDPQLMVDAVRSVLDGEMALSPGCPAATGARRRRYPRLPDPGIVGAGV